MSRGKFYLLLLSVQTVVAIIVYFTLSTIPEEELIVGDEEDIEQQVYWTYEEENGPKEWVSIDPSYYACGGGYEQSPINIEVDNIWEERNFKNIQLNYRPTNFLVKNNGHSVQVDDPTGKNTLVIDDQEYHFKHLHFHLPSEHQLDGKYYNMEGHLVHQSKEGKIAIIGFLIKEGKVNTDLANLWTLLPEEVTDPPTRLNRKVDLLELLPEDVTGFLYSGSLTTPPCTEGVTWIIMEDPVEMSAVQIEAFAEIIPKNNRPIQQMNERKVFNIELK